MNTDGMRETWKREREIGFPEIRVYPSPSVLISPEEAGCGVEGG